jgi:hypothetical protein
MSYEFYKGLHLVGLFLLFASLGGLSVHVINGGDRESNKARGLLAATHGVGLLIALIAGFGLLAKLHISPAEPWVIGKITLWLILGAASAVPYRKPELAKPLFFALPVLGAIGAYLALSHGASGV